MPLTAHDYKMALNTQGACNLSGLVHSLSEVITRIREDLREKGEESTDNVNTHPIVRLYVYQMAFLSGVLRISHAEYFEAMEICKQRSKDGKSQ